MELFNNISFGKPEHFKQRALTFKEPPPDVDLVDGYCEGTLLDGLLALRYKVLCEEQKCLPAVDYPAQQEKDQFDEQSVHVIAHKNGEVLGGVRMIRHVEKQPLPLLVSTLQFGAIELPPLDQSVEISRLVIAKSLRRRQNYNAAGIHSGAFNQKSLRSDGSQYSRNEIILLSLFREMYRYCWRNGIRYWFMCMEYSLYQSLKVMGLTFQVLGPVPEYENAFGPYLADLKQIKKSLFEKDDLLAKWMVDDSFRLFSPCTSR